MEDRIIEHWLSWDVNVTAAASTILGSSYSIVCSRRYGYHLSRSSSSCCPANNEPFSKSLPHFVALLPTLLMNRWNSAKIKGFSNEINTSQPGFYSAPHVHSIPPLCLPAAEVGIISHLQLNTSSPCPALPWSLLFFFLFFFLQTAAAGWLTLDPPRPLFFLSMGCSVTQLFSQSATNSLSLAPNGSLFNCPVHQWNQSQSVKL